MKARQAQAELRACARFPCARGVVRFCDRGAGCVVQAHIRGLPSDERGTLYCFQVSLNGCAAPYPAHSPGRGGAMELPPLLATCGEAIATFYTAAFTSSDVVGREVCVTDEASCCRVACGVAVPCEPFREPCDWYPPPCEPPRRPCDWPEWPSDPCHGAPRPCEPCRRPPEPCNPCHRPPEPCGPRCRPPRPCEPCHRPPEPCSPCHGAKRPRNPCDWSQATRGACRRRSVYRAY